MTNSSEPVHHPRLRISSSFKKNEFFVEHVYSRSGPLLIRIFFLWFSMLKMHPGRPIAYRKNKFPRLKELWSPTLDILSLYPRLWKILSSLARYFSLSNSDSTKLYPLWQHWWGPYGLSPIRYTRQMTMKGPSVVAMFWRIRR